MINKKEVLFVTCIFSGIPFLITVLIASVLLYSKTSAIFALFGFVVLPYLIFVYIRKEHHSKKIKKLIINVFAWFFYIIASLVLWFIGDLLLMFGVYGIFKDSNDAEWARYEQGELVYTIITILVFIIGGIILHLFLKKKLIPCLNAVLRFLNWDR